MDAIVGDPGEQEEEEEKGRKAALLRPSTPKQGSAPPAWAGDAGG